MSPENGPQASSAIPVEIAPGELIDKITILRIKLENIADEAKLANVRQELDLLDAARSRHVADSDNLQQLTAELHSVNAQLWRIEDEIRICERDKDFGERFIELARSVYRTNDVRARLKRDINELLGSAIVEEKDYQDYE